MENGWSVTLISEDRHCFRYLLLLMSIPFSTILIRCLSPAQPTDKGNHPSSRPTHGPPHGRRVRVRVAPPSPKGGALGLIRARPFCGFSSPRWDGPSTPRFLDTLSPLLCSVPSTSVTASSSPPRHGFFVILLFDQSPALATVL